MANTNEQHKDFGEIINLAAKIADQINDSDLAKYVINALFQKHGFAGTYFSVEDLQERFGEISGGKLNDIKQSDKWMNTLPEVMANEGNNFISDFLAGEFGLEEVEE